MGNRICMGKIPLSSDDSGYPNTGDIYKNFVYTSVESTEEALIETVTTFPYVILLGQSCDLRWEFDGRHREKELLGNGKSPDDPDINKCYNQRMISYLVSPLHPASLFCEGTHMMGYGWPVISVPVPKSIEKWEKSGVFSNSKFARYHAFNFEESTGITASVVDFKQFFSASPSKIIEAKNSNQYIGTLPDFFREQFLQRFSTFISRIGIPDVEDEK